MIQETVLENVATETVARQHVRSLTEHGYRVAYIRKSRTLREEPFVEHSYDVVLKYQHENERRIAMRVLGFFPD